MLVVKMTVLPVFTSTALGIIRLAWGDLLHKTRLG
jgi:hypothetical protein